MGVNWSVQVYAHSGDLSSNPSKVYRRSSQFCTCPRPTVVVVIRIHESAMIKIH